MSRFDEFVNDYLGRVQEAHIPDNQVRRIDEGKMSRFQELLNEMFSGLEVTRTPSADVEGETYKPNSILYNAENLEAYVLGLEAERDRLLQQIERAIETLEPVGVEEWQRLTMIVQPMSVSERYRRIKHALKVLKGEA